MLLAVLALHYAGIPPGWPAWAEHVYELIEAIATGVVLWRSFALPAEELERCAGTRFDADVVAAFRAVLQERMRARRAVTA